MEKPDELHRQSILRIVHYGLVVALILTGFYLSLRIFPLTFPFFAGMLFAETAAFLAKRIRTLPYRLHLSRKEPLRHSSPRLAVVLYFLLVIAVLALLIELIIVGIGVIRPFLQSLPSLVSTTWDIRGELSFIPNNAAGEAIFEAIDNIRMQIADSMPNVARILLGLVGRIINGFPLVFLVCIISLMCGYYYLNGASSIYRRALRITRDRQLVRNIFNLIREVILAIFRLIGGYLVLMMITFLECWIGFLIMGMQNALLWGAICAIIDVLPILGVPAVLLPLGFYLLLQGSPLLAFGCLVLMIVVMALRRLWEPLVLGTVMRLHPLVTLFSMIFGILVWGLSGVVLGPLYLITFLNTLRIFKWEDSLRQLWKNLRRSGTAVQSEKKQTNALK